MKKRMLSLLLLLVLTGCASPAPAEPDAPPEEPPAVSETASLPALTPLTELTTPAEITEGRAPAGGYQLPDIPPLGPFTDDDFPVLAAELPEVDALSPEGPSSAGGTAWRSSTGPG